MKNLIPSLFLILSGVAVQAASPSPGPLFTYEGLLTDAGSTAITTTQTVQLQIIYPASCVVFEETHSITPGSSGEFSVIVGSGTRTDSTGNTADRIFASSGNVTCADTSSVVASGFTTRSLRVRVGGTDLTPDVAINTVPFAINAARLADKTATDFVQISASTTQANADSVFSRYNTLNSVLNLFATPGTNGQLLIGTGTGYTPATLTAGSGINITNGSGSITISASGGGGSVTSVTALSPLVVGGTAAVPEIALPQANSTTNGFLSSTDWQAFNNKQNKTLSSGNIWVGNVVGSAAEVSVSGDATLNSSGVLSLANVGTAGTYAKVTTDAKGRVTSGSALTAADIPSLDWSKITSGLPATLGGYGISDAVKNMGGSPSIQSGTDAARPAPGTAGRIYISSDTNQIYRDTGSAWNTLGGGGGAALPISLTTEVTGILPIANGGTGSSSVAGAMSALSPLSTKGDLLVHNGTANVRLPAGASGQVLAADTTDANGVKWVTAPAGTVTAVTGNAPVMVSNNTTTPLISVSDATTSTKGVVQIGNGLNVTSGTVSVNPGSFPSVVPVTKGGTGTGTFNANKLVYTNASGSAFTEFACGIGMAIAFDGTGIAGCSSYSSLGVIVNSGNSLGIPMAVGTNDAFSLSFETNNTPRMTIDDVGRVGVGTTAPTSALHVIGTGEVARFVTSATGGVVIDSTALNYNPSLIYRKTNINRWSMMVNAASETGGNAGSNLSILRYDDTGATLGAAVTIDRASGFFGINTAAPAYNIHVTGTAGLSTGSAWTVASDARLKDVHGDYEFGLSEILKLHTVRYNYKKDNAAKIPSDVPMVGFIAQEVQQVIPDAVKTRADGYLELNVDPIHWATVNAVKELHGMCKATEEQLNTITRRVSSLEEDAAVKDLRIKALEDENKNLKKDLELIKAKLGLQ
ncbi:tail fiber domain-containing protein [Bdellovibrio bacteriovorus]|uniref:Cell wall surface anchor family protein n=1 Tax=Bdellovibrio bacteriovorus (strain ATCC 15356 / DSM 50701 / NCIMB 9529 / HD100) TaxID=264462 RepID=Q6MIH5_BDEBA|nr:tail fiber domain-containing protein [Bdellovibrio bacteriovorus]CAE80938.1 cell wall surface anchor family protein [Bdellovibrio bacteriovorus HD100]